MTRFPLDRILLVALLVCVAASASAQTRTDASQPLAPVTIKGRIFDAESGETMPYTNVFITGTNIGTMAFTDGFYIMRGLPPGTYTVKASYISYEMGSETVTLGPGEVINLDFHLEVNAIMVEPFEVAAERALIEVDKTGSSHYITAKEMESMPLDQVVDMIAQQPGVTLQDNEIHIRGGRADDTMFVVDGMNVSDPLAGGGYGYAIDPSIINEIEVLTGGFNAEYGQAVSGVVNVTTKEGSDRVEGKVSFKRDYAFHKVPKNDSIHWRDLSTFNEPHNIDIVKASISGPDPISQGLRALGLDLPGQQYMLLSGSMDIRDGYLPFHTRQSSLQSPVYTSDFWSPRAQNDWNGLAKWTWHMTPDHKLSINASRQVGISQGFTLPGEGYPSDFIDNMEQYLVFTTENILTQAYYRQVLSESSWYELTLGRNFNRLHANVNGSDDFLDPNYYQLRYYPQDWINGQASGSADRWHDHYSESYTMKGAYSFMGAGNNKFKTGFDLSFTEMQLVDLQSQVATPPDGKLAIGQDIFVAHPVTGAGYFQDTLDFHGMVVNAGVRLDFWAPGREVEKVMANTDDYLFINDDMADEFYSKTNRLFGRNWKTRISPRIGVSFPVTERDKFFFNYGHFSQWPRFAYVYPQLESTVASKIQLLGNPNLDPKVTVEYETGVQHEFGGLWSLGVTFYNRDIYDYAKSVKMESVDIAANQTPDPYDDQPLTIDPVRYFNGDSARSLGMEVTVIKRTTRWLSGSASVELQRTTGTNSDADKAYLAAVYGEVNSNQANDQGLKRSPLVWDKPWTLSMNLDFSVFDKDRPELFGWTMPPNWSLNLLARAEAGQRYTPYDYIPNGTADQERGDWYSQLGPYKSTVNLRFSKYWKFERNRKVTMSIEVRNLFNHKNFRRVNRYTGEGYQVGDYNPRWVEDNTDDQAVPPVVPNTDSEDYAKAVVDPSYIENPRVILWGVSYSW
jgi:outer membrane receptor for Fe3+-dicitrate